jgi:hypothetical protein
MRPDHQLNETSSGTFRQLQLGGGLPEINRLSGNSGETMVILFVEWVIERERHECLVMMEEPDVCWFSIQGRLAQRSVIRMYFTFQMTHFVLAYGSSYEGEMQQ